MKLILVRHGETFENIRKISQGHMNSQLSPLGVEQSKKIAQRLKDVPLDVVFTSDLDRASHTCREIVKFHENITVIETSILREQAKGVFEGKTKEERNKLLANETGPQGAPYHEWHPKDGERLVDVWDKVIPFIENIKQKYSGKNVLIVSHGGPISCILAFLHKKDIGHSSDYIPKNTAVSIISIERQKIEFDTLNCAAHL